MPIYRDYFIFIALITLSFIIAFILKKSKHNKQLANDRPIQITTGIMVVYYIIKFFFGWRFTNWYFEAVLMFSICLILDYYIIVKYSYSDKTQAIYYSLRILSITTPILALGIATCIMILSLGFSGGIRAYVVPIKRTDGEQWIYKNIYVYRRDFSFNQAFVFKKKILFFEKDIFEVNGFYTDAFRRRESSNQDSHRTGYISRNADIIYITYDKHLKKSSPLEDHIRLTIVEPDYIRIEEVSFSYNQKATVSDSKKIKF